MSVFVNQWFNALKIDLPSRGFEKRQEIVKS